MAIKTAIEHVKGLILKLWMMGIPLEGLTLLLYCEVLIENPINTAFITVQILCYCINKSVLVNSSMTDFVLKK